MYCRYYNAFYRIWKKEYDVPTTFFGEDFSIENSKKEKRIRIINYMSNAFILGIIFTVFNNISGLDIAVIQMFESKILLNMTNFLLGFIVFFIIDYLWGEFNVMRKNRFMNTLIDDDEK